MFYLVKSPRWLRFLYKRCTWKIGVQEKVIFLTFDDGPHPLITPFVLDELKRYHAKATFFCIGKNVAAYPEVYQRIIEEGHAVANHSYTHPDGWKTADSVYLDDIALAKKHIDSSLFRPPYGKITPFQLKQLELPRFELKTIMWTVLSGDFDTGISKEQCLNNVLLKTKKGAIIVFHDSEKAYERMGYALPRVLKSFAAQGFAFEKITVAMV